MTIPNEEQVEQEYEGLMHEEKPLTEEEKAQLRAEIEKREIPLTDELIKKRQKWKNEPYNAKFILPQTPPGQKKPTMGEEAEWISQLTTYLWTAKAQI